MIKECTKWVTSYASYKKGLDGSKMRGNESSIIDLEEGGPSTSDRAIWPRGRKATGQDLYCNASSLALHEILKGLIINKSDYTYERRNCCEVYK
jgi:hypothetical protein